MMRFPVKMRRIGLMVGLLATIAATLATSGSDDDAVVPVAARQSISRQQNVARPPAPLDAPHLIALMPRRAADEVADLFRVEQPVASPRASQPVPVEPERPTVPPLPFKYLGRLDDEGGTAVLLSYQGQELIGRAGETVGDRYRLDAIGEVSLRFVYLPLGDTQVLEIGERN